MKNHRVILEPGSYRDNENGRREETFALSFDTYVIAVIIKNDAFLEAHDPANRYNGLEIRDVQFAQRSYIEDHVLYVNKAEVEALVLEDDKLLECHLDIARPGERTRITPVKDVLEPRAGLFINVGLQALSGLDDHTQVHCFR